MDPNILSIITARSEIYISSIRQGRPLSKPEIDDILSGYDFSNSDVSATLVEGIADIVGDTLECSDSEISDNSFRLASSILDSSYDLDIRCILLDKLQSDNSPQR